LLPSGPGGVHLYLLREDQGGSTIIRHLRRINTQVDDLL
jgi:hypothetical protein